MFIRQIETISRLDEDDRCALRSLPFRIRRFEENRDIVREGHEPAESCLVIEGLVCRYKVVVGGRQILSLHFPGDMPDLQSAFLPRMDHSLAALTRTTIGCVPSAAIRHVALQRPALAAAFHRQALVDAAILREWVANIGRRLAIERVAHLICECFERMRCMGLTTDTTFELPITQTELGDATGLSTVHINRTLQALRQRGLVVSRGKIHTIPDWPRLREAADFNPAYLHLLPPLEA